MQSFGFTGYQMDEAGGLYFAQARRYDAGAGRFSSEDFIKGHIAVPYTMNHYNYCWNRPMDLVDLNGMTPTGPVAGVTASNMDALNGNSGSTPSAGAISGSFAPEVGNLIGAGVGFGTGLFWGWVDSQDFNGNGKSVREDTKDWFYGIVAGCEKGK